MEEAREIPVQASTEISQGELARLKTLVQERRVSWEVWPFKLALKGGGNMEVGFELILLGTHAHEEDRPLPGCEKCVAIFRDLKEIAAWIIPKVTRDSQYQIAAFDHAIRYAPERKNRPDVSLSLKILHRGCLQQPVDECEVLCLNEMKAKLAEIGAQHCRWRDMGQDKVR
jgi:hypothetical protein